MPRILWTPSDEDAKEYDLDGPQVFDLEGLKALRFSELEALETVTQRHAGLNLLEIYPVRDESMKAIRAVVWLSLWLSGRRLEWDDFDLHGMEIEFTADAGDDAAPLADGPDGDSLSEE